MKNIRFREVFNTIDGFRYAGLRLTASHRGCIIERTEWCFDTILLRSWEIEELKIKLLSDLHRERIAIDRLLS